MTFKMRTGISCKRNNSQSNEVEKSTGIWDKINRAVGLPVGYR